MILENIYSVRDCMLHAIAHYRSLVVTISLNNAAKLKCWVCAVSLYSLRSHLMHLLPFIHFRFPRICVVFEKDVEKNTLVVVESFHVRLGSWVWELGSVTFPSVCCLDKQMRKCYLCGSSIYITSSTLI